MCAETIYVVDTMENRQYRKQSTNMKVFSSRQFRAICVKSVTKKNGTKQPTEQHKPKKNVRAAA